MTQPIEFLRFASETDPQRTAIHSIDADLTYQELFDTVLRFARVFSETGVRPSQLVATKLPPVLDIVVSLALFHEGAVGGSVTPDVTIKNLEQFDWLISSESSTLVPPEKLILIDQAFLNRCALLAPEYRPTFYPNGQSLCRVSFSSGTTGEPKLIPWSFECLHDRAITRREQWMLDTPYMCLLGLSTGLGFMTFFAQLSRQEPYIVSAKGEQLLNQIKKFKVRCVMGSPHQLGLLSNEAISRPSLVSSIPIIMSAGSSLPDVISEQLTNVFGSKIVSTYASSESGSVAMRLHGAEPTFESATALYAGEVLDDVEVRIVNTNFSPLDEGQVGDIAIQRALQPQEYLGNKESSAQTFRDGFFLPGDRGFLRGKHLYLVGRSKEIIDMGGIKINPARVEQLALGFEGINDAAAFSKDLPNGLVELVLAFTSKVEIDPNAFHTFLLSQLGESAPNMLIRVPEIPRNHMGKVNRPQLAHAFLSE